MFLSVNMLLLIYLLIFTVVLPSVLWCCWLGGWKGIWPVKNWSGGMLVWLSVWIEVQTCIWPSWCQSHSLSLASVKSRLVLPFWYGLTWVVPEKGPLNGCVCVIYFHCCTTEICLCAILSGKELVCCTLSSVFFYCLEVSIFASVNTCFKGCFPVEFGLASLHVFHWKPLWIIPRWTGTRKLKPIWILLKQETVSGSGISWGTCKFAPRSRQITVPALHHSIFYRSDALPAAQPTASKHWKATTIGTGFYQLDAHT